MSASFSLQIPHLILFHNAYFGKHIEDPLPNWTNSLASDAQNDKKAGDQRKYLPKHRQKTTSYKIACAHILNEICLSHSTLRRPIDNELLTGKEVFPPNWLGLNRIYRSI